MKKAFSLLLTFVICSGVFFSGSAAEDLPSPEECLSMVPDGAYQAVDESITFKDLLYTDLLRNYGKIVLDKLFALELLKKENPPYSENPQTDPHLERISVKTVEEVFELCFGKGTFSLINPEFNFIGHGGVLTRLDGGDEYVFRDWRGGGDPACAMRKTIVSSATVGDELTLVVRFGICSIMDFGTDPSKIFADVKMWAGEGQSSCMAMIPQEQNDAFRNGAYDEYLPVYTHTFKQSEDGTYYWYSTKMTEGPKTIPQNLVHSYPSPSTNPASGTETDLPTSDTGTNLPTESNSVDSSAPTDSGTAGDEESSPLWIYVAAGLAVAVAAALGIFFAVKKKKA